jgi:hypothetical protein
MKQVIVSGNQTRISIVQGDTQVFIQTDNHSQNNIVVNTNGIHIQIQTGGGARVNPTYDTYEEVAPLPLPGPVRPVTPPSPTKPKFNYWPFTKSATYVSDLPIQTTEFVRQALLWCEKHIEKPPRSYKYELKYYKAKKVHGTYQFATRKITVYVYPSLTLKSLCETLIHEYSHHLFIRTQADQNEYDRLKRKHGYLNNPHEVNARRYEDAYGTALWEYMKGALNGK